MCYKTEKVVTMFTISIEQWKKTAKIDLYTFLPEFPL